MLALPILGGSEVLARSAHEFAPPRVQALRRISRRTAFFALLTTPLGAFLFVTLVPATEWPVWTDAPLAGLALHSAGPVWARDLAALALACAAVLMLLPTAHAALADVDHMLQRWSSGLPAGRLAALHTRFGAPTRSVDVGVAATIMAMLVSGGRVTWLARAYAIAVAVMLVLKVAMLVRLRRTRPEPRPFTAPANLRIGRRELPVGLMATGLIGLTAGLSMIARGDGPSVAATALIATLALWVASAERRTDALVAIEERDTFDLLPSTELSLDHGDTRPGGVLVPVRNPHALGHVVAALRAAGDRDVVVMTVRLIGVDVSEETSDVSGPTPYERRLLADVAALAERHRRSVRLLIVPARNVVEAIVATIVRLRSSEVYVGESASLSANDQARLLGEAWERIDKPEALDVRLVVHHRSGRSEMFHLGAHPPSLSPGDLDLIHRLWIDAVKAVGPHVHHHDIVRAALTQMEHQLSGPQRDEALGVIRELARPAEELAAVVHARDYTRLRDMLRNHHASEVAALLTELPLEDEVVVFRVLPRKDAAAVFEDLSQDAKEALLKAKPST